MMTKETVDIQESRAKWQLEEIIVNREIYPVYQPIVSLRDGTIYGYESLSRMRKNGRFSSVEEMFVAAEQYNLVWELEQICRKVGLQGIYEQNPDFDALGKKLFLNVNPRILDDKKFRAGFTREYLKRYHIGTDRIVFEVTERQRVDNAEGFYETVGHYKNQGYQIAVDDVGSGYAGLNLICSLTPYYIKLDRNLINNIHRKASQYAMVKGMVEFSASSGVLLIAEGIETKRELQTLIDLGVQYGQGYYLYRPETWLQTEREVLCQEIREQNQKRHCESYLGVNYFCIGNLASRGMVVKPEDKVEQVEELLQKNQDAIGVSVVEQGRILGIMTREKLFKQLGGRYGFYLHHNKPILELADRNFLRVDAKTSVSSVAKFAMERETESLYDFIVVTEADQYLGIVTVRNLLSKSTEINVDAARSANPLTGLPGNVIIKKEIQSAKRERECFCISYYDLDNFKAFNDVYGFEKGDEVIRLLADILKMAFADRGFVGHIGGDDFVSIQYGKQSKEAEKEIRSLFESRARQLYSESDRQNNYITAKNRHGVIERFPLVSVTIVSVESGIKDQRDSEELIGLLARLKKEEKANGKNGKE